jgi:hypothetical protein
MASNSHIVTAPLVIVRKPDGADQYLYTGALVPEFVEAEDVKRLTDEGFIDKVSAAEAKNAPAPASESN